MELQYWGGGPIMSNTALSDRLLAQGSLLLAMVLWGSSFVAMKYALMQLDSYVVVFGRMLVASVCFLPLLKTFRRLTIQRKQLSIILAMGFCEPCLYFIFEAAALSRTTASQASIITSLLPPMVALCAAFFFKEKLTRRLLAGFALAAAGAVWLSLAAGSTETAPAPLLGNFLEFLAMVCATGYIILLKYLSRSLPTLFLTATQAFIGTLFFLPFLFLPQVHIPQSPDWSAIGAVFYLGTVVTIGAYGLYNYGVSKVPASQAAAAINLIPAFAIFFGYLLLGERLGIWQVFACLLVFAGVYLSQSGSGKKEGVQQEQGASC
jgi:drug/metabolite transporter (DMT)-like permease